MSLTGNLKFVKKYRNEEAYFGYNSKEERMTVWNENFSLSFKQKIKECPDVCLNFDEFWGAIKNLKVKEVETLKISIDEKDRKNTNVSFVKQDSKNKKETGKTLKMQNITVPTKNKFLNVKDKPVHIAEGDSSLYEIVKQLEKSSISLDMYPGINRLHFVGNSIFICDLVSIERYKIIGKEYSFSDNFSVFPVHMKMLESFKKKTYSIYEYKESLLFSTDDIQLWIKKQEEDMEDLAVSENIEGTLLDIEWTVGEEEAKEIINNSISSTDKKIQCVVTNGAQKNGFIDRNDLLFVKGKTVGRCSEPFVASFKTCTDGLDKKWYKSKEYFWFNYDSEENHQRFIRRYF